MSLLTPMMRSSSLTAWFSDAQRVQGMLDFEAALIRAQAACGIVPQAAVAPVVNACRHSLIDFSALGEAAADAGNLAIPLVRQLTACVKATDPQAARYVHWGATSQDAIDSGLILQLRGALAETDSLLQRLMAEFARQAQRHQHTVMPGRTWMQHALPVTFGLKLAGTLDALLRWQQRLREMRARVLVLQFGGAAGTLDSLKGTDRRSPGGWRPSLAWRCRTPRGTASAIGCWKWGPGTPGSAGRWVNLPTTFRC